MSISFAELKPEVYTNLVDPNKVNTNPNIINSIPPYENMHIFVELVAYRKGRSVIVKNGNLYEQKITGMEQNVVVHLMGYNQNEGVRISRTTNNGENSVEFLANPHYFKYTTNYYEGSTGNEINYESFGITNIKITVNSSFVPQIDIQFLDIRGLSFFNQPNSPYRILFDFPPPITELTIKGYYGVSLTYKLHLVKYTTEFNSDSGNFIINAQFVGLTYAPLTDVLFRYIVNFPLLSSNIQNLLSPSPEKRPRNTYELILKLKKLMPAVKELVNGSTETKNYDSTNKRIDDVDMLIEMLLDLDGNEKLKSVGEPKLYTQETSSEGFIYNDRNFNEISNIQDYDYFLSTNNDKYHEKRLFIGYNIGQNTDMLKFYSDLMSKITLKEDFEKETNVNRIKKVLNEFIFDFINKAKEINSTLSIEKSDFGVPVQFICDSKNKILEKNIINASTLYVGIDITNIYVKLKKEKTFLLNEKRRLASTINNKINEMVYEQLGMMPTIYNIFEIILNDVDVFFETLKQTSILAEQHHNSPEIYSLISGNDFQDFSKGNNEKRIFAFPLIISRNSKFGGVVKQERIAPIELDKTLPKPFPEMKLIYDFIDTFLTQKINQNIFNLKVEQTESGNNIWFPITPYDSYFAREGGGSLENPYLINLYNIEDNNVLFEFLTKILQRFYILSEYSLPNVFFGDTKNDNYIKLFAEAEANNLAVSLSNNKIKSVIKTFAEKYQSSNAVNGFYMYLNNLDKTTKLYNTYNFSDLEKMPLSENDYVYVDKTNENFKGAHILSEYNASLLNIDDNEYNESDNKKSKLSKNPVVNFTNDVKRKKMFGEKQKEGYFSFTKENVIFIADKPIKFGENFSDVLLNSTEVYDNTCLNTRFVLKKNKYYKINYVDYQRIIINGNKGIDLSVNSFRDKIMLFENILDLWIKNLDEHKHTIYRIINNNSDRIGALLFLSNFGNTLSIFNVSPSDLRNLIFDIPSIVEIPKFLSAYIGLLVDVDDNFLNELKEFYLNGDGLEFDVNGSFIFADIHDFKNYLSEHEKNLFREKYNSFMTESSEFNYYKIKNSFNKLYPLISGTTKEKQIRKVFSPFERTENNNYFENILLPLIKREYLSIYSQLTFSRQNGFNNGKYYKPLVGLVKDKKTQETCDMYFSKFFNKLALTISDLEEKNRKEIEENKKLKVDDNIITQTYYSFKNINDKWLTNSINSSGGVYGYPFNRAGKRLIDSFVFVDRAMNPIGDTIINPEILIQFMEDPNISVFTVISQLLSANGFEFFPLQNFMKYTNDDWKESFKIHNTQIVRTSPYFVCMYIGGFSSYPSDGSGDFPNDGILKLDEVPDFNATTDTNGFDDESNKKQTLNSSDFPWREVRAFRIRFGEQNQSMFRSIKIDCKEFPETNESIQILSRLAGDGGAGAPVPQGQNLYNVYENRAYRATITGLGNASIQPTQYFQLENVPLFNGAYLILSVEHVITANKMETTFSGTKILRFPYPRVLSPAAIFGMKTDEYISEMSAGEVISNFGSAKNLDDISKVISMYTLKI